MGGQGLHQVLYSLDAVCEKLQADVSCSMSSLLVVLTLRLRAETILSKLCLVEPLFNFVVLGADLEVLLYTAADYLTCLGLH